MRGGGDGQHVVEAHDDVGDGHSAHRAPEVVAAFDGGLVGLVLDQQLDGDPQQQEATDQSQPGQLEHVGEDDGEEDAQADGRAGAKDDAPEALLGRQPSAGQRDDDGIVAGEQDVDPDDLKNLDTKRPVFPKAHQLREQLIGQLT